MIRNNKDVGKISEDAKANSGGEKNREKEANTEENIDGSLEGKSKMVNQNFNILRNELEEKNIDSLKKEVFRKVLRKKN